MLSRKAIHGRARGGAGDRRVHGGLPTFRSGGWVVIGAAYMLSRTVRRWREGEPPARWRAAWPWVVANALAGATIGVGFLQFALASTPSAVVLRSWALTPLLVVPFAYFLEGERPTARSLLGGLLAVAAAVGAGAGASTLNGHFQRHSGRRLTFSTWTPSRPAERRQVEHALAAFHCLAQGAAKSSTYSL